MPTKKDATGHRKLEMSIELPGTPEQVWQAIATGQGISSWFVPAQVDERKGGMVAFRLAPDVTSAGVVTHWEPPYRFAYEEPGWSGEAPPLATEFTIESKTGGTCTVRLVHSLFTSSDEWDDQIDSMENGWPAFFEVLRVYLANFAGARSASIRPTGSFDGSMSDAWSALMEALNMSNVRAGEYRSAKAGSAPPLAGFVERSVATMHQCALMLRLDEPSGGVALLSVYKWAEPVRVSISLYFYGDDASETAARYEPEWTDWMGEHFASEEVRRV